MKRLLIVEDDADTLEVVRMILAEEGYEVRSTSRSEEIYSMAQEYKPDLIILDFIISGIDSTPVCKKLKAGLDTGHIPIIIFSAHPMAEGLVKDSGADNFIAKPFNMVDFLRVVRLFANGK